MRHSGARHAAADHRDELLAAKLAAPQVRRAARRLTLSGAIAGPAVTITAIGFFEEHAPPLREVLRGRAPGRNHCQCGDAGEQGSHAIDPSCWRRKLPPASSVAASALAGANITRRFPRSCGWP